MSARRESPDTQSATDTRPALIKRGWFQGILVAVLLLCSAVIALYLSIVPLLNNWLPPLLDRLVAPGSHLQVRSLTRQQFAVDELDIQPAPGLLIQVRNAELNYHGTSLLQGKADSLYAETIKVLVSAEDESSTASARSGASAQTELPLITDLMDLPISDIRIQSIELDTPDISARLTATLTPTHWLITGDARLPHIQEPVMVNLQLQRGDDGNAELLAMLSQREKLLAQLWSGVEQAEQQSSARVRLEADLNAMQSSLPQLADFPLEGDKVIIAGKMSSANQAHWPEELFADLTATVTTQNSVISPQMRVDASALALSAMRAPGAERWSLLLAAQPIKANITTGNESDLVPWDIALPGQAITADCTAAFTECELSGQLSGVLNGLSETRFSIKPDGHWQNESTSYLRLPLALTYQQEAQQGLPGWSMEGTGALRAELSATGDWQLTSADGFALTIKADTYQGWTPSELHASLLPELSISGNIEDTRIIHAKAARIKLSPFTVSSDEYDALLRFAPANLNCNPGEINTNDLTNGLLGNCQISMRLNDSDWGLWPIPDISLSGPFTLTMDELRERVNASLDLTAANGEVHFRTRTEHDLLTGRGSLQWHLTDARLDWMALGLSKMANLTSVQLLNGHLSGQGWLDWQQVDNEWQVIPDMMLRADGVGLIYDNTITLEEWNAMLALRSPAGSTDYLLDAQLSGSKLNSGIPLSKLLARTQTRFPADFSYFEVDVHEIHTDLLGGRIYAPLIQYDSRKEINSFGIRLDHLQLSHIAAIEKEAGINATGLLDGMLPIVLTKEGPMVPGGNLFARDPGGVIRYQDESADTLAQADQSVGMAMKLLQNFHYDELQSGVRYQPDGQLDLSLQFEGNNPDFFGGQATHLNVNLEYNLLDLLESLRISNEVIEKVEQKYQ